MCLSHSVGINSHRITDQGHRHHRLCGGCHRRRAALLKHSTRCMSLRTCTCKWPAGPHATISTLLSGGALLRIPQALSHGHCQPACAIYENKRTPLPSEHAWHPPGWRQPRVSCSALSPFSCVCGGRCVPGDRTLLFSRVEIASSTWQSRQGTLGRHLKAHPESV